MGRHDILKYQPTWVDTDVEGDAVWIVYDQREGFQPAYALVFGDTADDAAEVARVLSSTDADGFGIDPRLDPESESLVVVELRRFTG